MEHLEPFVTGESWLPLGTHTRALASQSYKGWAQTNPCFLNEETQGQQLSMFRLPPYSRKAPPA